MIRSARSPALALRWLLTLLGGHVFAAEPPLTRVAEVRSLKPEQAQHALPVKVRGVVTLVFGTRGDFLVDDGTGIYVWPQGNPGAELDGAGPVARGDVVELEGHSAPGHFAPIIMADRVRVTGRDSLPIPHEVPLTKLLTGQYDCQRISIRGVVRSVSATTEGGKPRRDFAFVSERGRCDVHLFDPAPIDAARFVDADVCATGVCLPYFNTRGEQMGIRIVTDSPDDFVIERAAPPDPYSVPQLSSAQLLPFSPEGTSPHRRRLTGTVSLCRPGRFFYLQDGALGVRITTRQTDALAPGDRVEASGFAEIKRHYGELGDAIFRRTGSEPPPKPVEVTREKILGLRMGTLLEKAEDFDGRLVELRGRLDRMEPVQEGGYVIYLESGGGLVPMELDAGLEAAPLLALRPGSEVRVMGICVITFSEPGDRRVEPRPKSFHLLLRGAQDVVVLRPAPWWTPRRLWTALGITASVLATALVWVWTLRRRVRQRTGELAEEMRRRRDAQVEFSAELRERNRLATDLHDLLEQDLAAVGYQLEAERLLRDENPEQAREHLALADHFLVHSQDDVHRSVWNLRAGILAGRSLIEALRETAQRLASGRGIRCHVAEESTLERKRALPVFISGNLLLFAQEAISNAVKHAAPTRIDLKLSHDAAGVTLMIADDGCGFDPSAVEGPDRGHFGLTGMRERLKRLAGSLRIETAADGGTRLVAHVPAAEIALASTLADE